MKEDIQEFFKILEQRATAAAYEENIERIRQTYKGKIPAEDVVTPIIIMDLEREKKRLDKKWGEEGKLSVDKAFGKEEDASAYLFYETGNLTCSVHPVFRDGYARVTHHRKERDFTGTYTIDAHISHPYHEGDALWARASKDRTNWEILYRNEQTGRSTVKYRTKNFCNLRSLEKTLKKLEDEWDVMSKGHRAIW